MNILLTQRCTRSCPYCFALRHMDEAPPDDVLGWEDLIYLVDLLQADGERQVSFLGGEPTLHPEFVDFCLYAIARGVRVTVFTNGMLSPAGLARAVRHLGPLPREMLGFVCNLNHPEITPPAEALRVDAFLEAFGPRTTPGFNIYRPDFDLDFLFERINRYGLSRHLRLGLTHRIPGATNAFIAIADMRRMVERLFSYREKFERHRVGFGPDCGFPLCAFTDAELGWLYQTAGAEVRFKCGPALDVGPDMTVWSCFPLSNHHKRSIFEFDSLADIHRFYSERLQTIRVEVAGIFPQCDGCRHRENGICDGGCAAHALASFVDEAPVRLPECYS